MRSHATMNVVQPMHAMNQTSEESDESIIARVIAGDSAAFGLVLRRYEQKLLRYVIFLIHDEVAAADIVQDTFIKAYQNLKGYNPSYKFSSWIYRIAHNETMNAVKRNRHQSGEDITTLPELSYEPKIAEQLDLGILQSAVRDCVARLEPKYREIIQLIYFEQMKYDEAGEVLHVPTSTVGVWLKRAKEKLRVICEQKGTRHD